MMRGKPASIMTRRSLLAGAVAGAGAIALRPSSVAGSFHPIPGVDPDYTVIDDGAGYFYAVSGETGQVDFEGSDGAQVLLAALDRLKMPPDHPISPNTVVNRHIVVRHRKGGTGWPWRLSQRLDLPPMQGCIFDARSISWFGAGVRLDSMMDCWVYFGLIEARDAEHSVLEIAPRTTGPDRVPPTWIDSYLQVSALGGLPAPYAPGTAAFRLSAANGHIRRSKIVLGNIGSGEHGIYIPDSAANVVDHIDLTAALIVSATNAITISDTSEWGGSIRYNRFSLGMEGRLTNGVVTHGCTSLFNLWGEIGATNKRIWLKPGAAGNTFLTTSQVHPAAFFDESGQVNTVIAPGL